VPDRDGFLAALARDAGAFADLVADADLDVPVPACPGWTVRDLASHLGGIHRWAEQIVASGAPGDEPRGPHEREALHEWFVEGAAQLVARLTTTPADSPAWTFGPRPREVSFWVRRQAHETSMHLGDALRALGEEHSVGPGFAADGVDEVVRVFFPGRVRRGRIPPLSRGIRIVLDDDPRTFVLAGDGTDAAARTDATLSGPSHAVLLALWGRAGLGGLGVEGDPDTVLEVLAAGLTP
jgi:uncharacterized protein (TIGR03083 family)